MPCLPGLCPKSEWIKSIHGSRSHSLTFTISSSSDESSRTHNSMKYGMQLAFPWLYPLNKIFCDHHDKSQQKDLWVASLFCDALWLYGVLKTHSCTLQSTKMNWKGSFPCVANKWQFAFRAAIFTALMGFYTGPFLLDYPHPISLINASAEFSNQIILNCVRICEDEHWGGAKRACLGFWLMRVTFSSTCHLQLMLLNHHPPLVERWGRNKKWHSAFFFLPLPPAGRHKTIWRQNSAIRFKPLREMRCNW